MNDLRVLHLEDNPVDQVLVEGLLAPSGCRVRPVATLEAAREVLARGEVDLVLADLGVEDSGGVETVAALRQAAPDVPVVVLTGAEDATVAVETLQLGAQDFLIKGRADRSRLVQAIERARQRQDAFEGVRARYRELQSALDALLAHVAVIDASGTIAAVNVAWRSAPPTSHAVGASYEPGSSFLLACELAASEDRPDRDIASRTAEAVRRVLDGSLDQHEELFACEAGGSRRWYRLFVTPFSEGTGRAVVSRQDVTALQESQEATRHQLDIQAGLAQVARGFVGRQHRDLRQALAVLFPRLGAAAACLCRLADSHPYDKGPWARGASPDDARGMPDRGGDFVPVASWPCGEGAGHPIPAVTPELIEQLRRGVPVTMPGGMPCVRCLHHDTTGLATAVPVMDGSGVLRGFCIYQLPRGLPWSSADEQGVQMFVELVALEWERDVAEDALRRSEEKLRHAVKMEAVGRLASGIAHDFNNLMNVVLGCAGLAREDLAVDHPVQQELDEVMSAARKATELTKQLMAYSKASPGVPQGVHLNELVREAERMLVRTLGRECNLVAELATDLPPVWIDPGHLEQILLNVAVNAKDAMPQGGTLQIRTEAVTIRADARDATLAPGRFALLTIQDDGVGMSDEVRAHLFEPFFTTKAPGKGSGLGLATCYGIARKAGGDIRVESTPGQGTTVRVYLPAWNGR